MSGARSPLDGAAVLLVGTTEWVSRFAETLEPRGTEARTVETAAAALDAVRRERPACVVSEYALEGSTGLELARSLGAEWPALPVLLCTAEGSERVASDAFEAGVDDYVAAEASPAETVARLLERTERALRAAEERATERERARQFDAVFEDARAATWVLDDEGALRRANETASGMLAGPVDAHLGEPFWESPWWAPSDDIAADVHRVVETALDGGVDDAVVSRATADGRRRVLDLSVRPVEDHRGQLTSVVVEGVDITDRVELERDLRRSEELHRVTLNNMTDTVLITDESGAYTYVCPNVHFIFGYRAEEIRELGTIDDLLGADLFDREELAERGVLKNIECTATDKAGREHTLLVNVREVSIQDGTLLYSCRDITKRKQREEALATLQETARDFLYAETHREIAQHVVEDTPGVLDTDASAVYLFDADTNDLRPAAASARMRELNGPLPDVHADGATLTSHSFVEDEPLFFDDVHEADRLANPATDLRSACYIPLGDHGVFVAGSERVGAFDAVTRELADLLAATAEAALDRVSRESRLREQDRTLQRRNRELSELNRVNETIREIDRAVVRAETRAEVDHAVCERLTAEGRFAFAWIGTVDPTAGRVDPRAWAGDDQGYLDTQSFALEETGGEPAGRSAATGAVTMVSNVADGLREEPWRKEALARDYLSVIAIPLVYNDLTHGVLTVYAGSRDAFDDRARAVLAELGETVAAAISAIERKHALLSTSMTRVEFETEARTFVLSRLAHEADATLSYDGGIQQREGGLHVFVSVEDGGIDAVERAAADLVGVGDVRRMSTSGEGGVLRLGLAQPFPALELADHGAVFRGATATPTTTTLVVDVPESVDVRNVTQLVRAAVGEVTLRSKRQLDRAAEQDPATTLLDRLTERQLEVVQTAYYSGFFESPRENTGEDVAEMLDISPAAFYQHVRTVQRKLFATLFEEHTLPLSASGVE
ncbi:GAF domain-containing protein [Salinirubellus salinus]|uniref:GAF domain-containing protein n=1 Tax=Salinirubellus salinus TaxID=1364945 RepID=A0A9E7U9U1_9EURY|nr:bacterio-opsin activator domain-containing protein [Salinirubellus salinus]UWM53357.1 GAF domain-containing protein [Salinirubellus salinus]